MKVTQAMTDRVRTIAANASLEEAAKAMSAGKIDILPVFDGSQLVGGITDRDIVVRAVAGGYSPNAPVRRFMTAHVNALYENDDLASALDMMEQRQVRHIMIKNNANDVIGILSCSDVACLLNFSRETEFRLLRPPKS